MTFISSKSPAHFCLFLAYIGLVIQAQAALVVYTSEGAFDTAALEFGTQDFTDDLNSGSKFDSTVTLTDVTISGNSILSFPNFNNTNKADGTGYLRLHALQANGPVTFTFSTPLVAFGFDINPRSQGIDDLFSVDTSAGGASASFSMPSSDITEFRGFVSDSVFTTFTLNDAGGSASDFYGIDNLVAYSAVPEPSTYAAILGLVCLGRVIVCRRFKRS